MITSSTQNADEDDASEGVDTESVTSEEDATQPEVISRTLGRRSCKSLIRLASSAYLRFLERECATYVQLLLHDSPLWRSTRNALFNAMKNHIRNTFQRYAKEYEVEIKSRKENGASSEQATTLASRHRLRTGFIRGMLMDDVLSGRFPSDSFRNSYRTNDPNNYRGLHGNEHGGESDSDLTAREIESLKLHGRKCGSVCCSGGFLVETMLCVLVNEDVDCINLEGNRSSVIYKDKPLQPLLPFDSVNVISHYVDELDRFQNKTNYKDAYRWNQPSDIIVKEYPALQSLKIEGSNLGTMGEQRHYKDILQSTVETQDYINIPWKLSKEKCRPTTHHMMITLAKLFDRGTSFKHSFYFLKELRLGRDCLNTDISLADFSSGSMKYSKKPLAHPVIRMMSGIARSCPSLEVIDFSGVLSLSPESLVYLFFRDAFETLHKYMYLPTDPNLMSREISSRRRSAAASMSLFQKPFGREQQLSDISIEDKGIKSDKFDEKIESKNVCSHDTYKHGMEGRRLLCPWCISESSLTPRSSSSSIFEDGASKASYFKNDVSRELYVLDDRLYDYIETNARNVDDENDTDTAGYLSYEILSPGQFLRYCVKVSQLVDALSDDDYFLDCSSEESSNLNVISGNTVNVSKHDEIKKYGYYRKVQLPSKKSTLCGSLKQLKLPFSLYEDSCSWILPLMITAAPNLTSIGKADVYDGLELLKDIVSKKAIDKGVEISTNEGILFKTNLEEVNVSFEDTATSRIREDMNQRLKSLAKEYLHWNQFIRPNDHSLRLGTYLRSYSSDSNKKSFHLDNWIRNTFAYRGSELLAEPQVVKARWIEKVKTIAKMCPRLKTLKMSIQPSILFDEVDAFEVWAPFASQMSTGVKGWVPYLTDISVYDSCWSDVSGLLKVAGDKIEKLELMLRRDTKYKISDATSMEQINMVPLLCPRMRQLKVGYTHGTGIGTDRKLNHALNITSAYPDQSYSCYRYIQEFEANGNITITAFEFLWNRALMLKELNVKGAIVVDGGNMTGLSDPSPSGSAGNGGSGNNTLNNVGPAENPPVMGGIQANNGNDENGIKYRCRYSEIVFTSERVFRLFSLNPMVALTRINVPMTFASIDSATRWLDMMPLSVRHMAHLTVKVSIPSETAGGGTESIGDLVATCLRQMVEFKLNCRKREVENDARVGWSWRREGILTILLQQQIMTSVSELIDP